tara:strand:- start:12368 stop:12553 length:186 start_codon:yes stop_codon:yes gene_type:complete
MPGVAAAYTLQRQKGAFKDTVNSDSFLRIGGATGIKATMIAHKWAETGLVTSDDKNQQTTH